jgi:hypothetical protein
VTVPLTSPGWAMSSRERLELELRRVTLRATRKFLREVQNDALAALEHGGSRLTLGEVLGRWEAVVQAGGAEVAKRLKVPANSPQVLATMARLRALPIPTEAQDAVSTVLFSRRPSKTALKRALSMRTGETYEDVTGKVVQEGADWYDRTVALARSEATVAFNSERLKELADSDATEVTWVCVAPWQRVSARGIHAVARRHHVGQIVTLGTASGSRLAVTPDHRILTGRGWVAAESVHVGDHTFHVTGADAAMGPHVDNGPPTIEEVFNTAMAAVSVQVGAVGGGVDLHVDHSGGQVEVIRADGDLFSYVEATFPQGGSDILFASADVLASRLELSCGDVGLVSVAGRTPFPGRHETLDSPVPDLLGVSLSPQEPGSRPSSDRDTGSRQQVLDHLRGCPSLDAEGADRGSAEVLPDEVVSVEISSSSGHVYDLSTVDGWFLSENHIIHNCHHDAVTRPTHLAADGQTVRIGTPFIVGGFALAYPGDPLGPIQETAGCRCVLAGALPT